MPFTLPDPWIPDASVQRNFDALATRLTALQSGPLLVTSLPTTPSDGQQIYYVADATQGIVWHLRYNAGSASAYKWEFVGGPPLTSPMPGAVAVSTTVITLTGVTFTPVFAGEYNVQYGAALYQANNATLIKVMPYVGGADSGFSARFITPAAGQNDYVSVMSAIQAQVLTASQTIDLRAVSAGAGGSCYLPWMWLSPVRIG